MDRLANKVAIVTGGGQGIGEGIALALARESAAVVVTGRTPAKLHRVVDQIHSFGGRALAAVGDVGSRSDVSSMVASTVEAFGTVDILVNNAQSSVQRLVEDTDDDDIELAYRSGPLGTLFTMQSCFPYLKMRGGVIINTGTPVTIQGEATFGSYNMAKEAIRALSKVAAREWGQYSIRVNVICPNAWSPASLAYMEANPELFANRIAKIPLGRKGDPENDIGRAVVALSSDDFQYVTGATIMLDGGGVFIS